MRVSSPSRSRRTNSTRLGRLGQILVVASLPLAAMTFAPAAFAQDAASQDIAQARQLGQQAQAAFDAGNFPESEKCATHQLRSDERDGNAVCLRFHCGTAS